MELFEHVGARIRTMRAEFDGRRGISQEALAAALKVSPNTVSRWETATYQPSLRDLDRLARFFGVSILAFLPGEPETKDEKVAALLRTAQELDPSDLEELRRFAEFRRAQAIYDRGRPRRGRRPHDRLILE